MKANFTHFYFLISCPSDVEKDINVVFEIIDDINHSIGEENYIYIVPLFWKRDAIPSAGSSAQNIINHQLLDDADGVIALFWTKFGTPTDTYGSGTEEEIERAISENKDVILLYSERRIAPQQINYEQFRKVEEFKKNYNGLFAPYCNDDDLKEKLRRILTKLIFNYSKDLKNIETKVTQINSTLNYSLSEYFELGWFMSRSNFEMPTGVSSTIQEINLFKDRISSLLALVIHYNLLNDERYHLLVEYSREMQSLGFKGYIEKYGRDAFATIQEILNICKVGLERKLTKKNFAAFQIGMIYGYYLLSIQIQWIEKENIHLLKDVLNTEGKEFKAISEKIFSFLNYINPELYENIKVKWDKCHENKNVETETYCKEMSALVEEIAHCLQMYS